MAPLLASEYRCIMVDLPGHGESGLPEQPGSSSMWDVADWVRGTLESAGIERAAVLGYSMGGRVALHLALEFPEFVSALICESASPGIESASERDQRRHQDDELSHAIVRDGVERFVDHWERLPLFESQSRLPPSARERVRTVRTSTTPEGAAWAISAMSPGRQDNLWPLLSRLDMPTLLLAGLEDQKYSEIARRMDALCKRAEVEIVPGAGHTVHLEQPEAFGQSVLDFLRKNWTGGKESFDFTRGGSRSPMATAG